LEALRHIRTMRGMNQVDLAKASGVAQNTISEIELGKREARPGTLKKLADALDVDIPDFFAEPEHPLATALPSQEKLFNNGALDEERRSKVEVFVSCMRYAIGRAEYYERELERGRTDQYATASGALTLAQLALAEFSSFVDWLFSGALFSEPVWELLVAHVKGSGSAYRGDFEATMAAMIDRQNQALRTLFDNAEQLAETEQQKDALAAKRQRAAELNARMERLSA
jgi:transcriptional regulator with XRE-family HTH domain